MKKSFLPILAFIMTGSMMLTGFSFSEKKITIPEENTAEDGTRSVELTYLQFEGEDLPASLSLFNQELQNEANDACNKFLKIYSAESGAQLSGTYTLSLQNEKLISLRITHTYTDAGADEEYFNEFFYNLQVESGKNLQFEDCFSLKTTPEEWMDFVESEGGNLDRKHPLPASFLVNEYGVVFLMLQVEGELDFMWEDLEPYFEIKYLKD